MPVENLKERTVEVLSLPEEVNEELLCLYFENKRRSGGGPVVSVEKKGDCAVLVFEDAEAAAQVLSKGHHVLHNVELIVRRPAAKDQCRLLLRGINPNTSSEMIELFVENMIGLNPNEYQLCNLSGGDVLIHLNQPLSQDFQTLCGKVSRKTLETARVTLEQIEQTCSILVENLLPGTTQDLLMLYFESERGGNQRVRDVTMLSEGTAKVSFVNYESVGPILDQQHKLDGAELLVKPYFDFLQPTETTSQSSASGGHDLDAIQMQTNSDSQSSSQTTSERLAEGLEDTAEEAMDDSPQDVVKHIAIADPVKLALFQLSPLSKEIARTHPDFTMEVKEDGMLIEGSDMQKLELIKQTIMDFVGNLVQTHFTLEPEKAQFLEKQEVKDRLLQTIIKTPSPTLYSVSDCKVVVTSLSQTSAQQAFTFLTSQMCHFSIPLDKERESMLYCREWSEFLQTLDFSSVRMSEHGENIDVLTLKGMENEKQTAILQFLSKPIERDTLITMEPGALKYIQTHCHQLLADMDQVSIFPVEAEDVCGLKISGPAVTCQMAEEVLQSVLSSICTKTIAISAPGVARFLHETECKNLLTEMESKFEVHISLQFTPWLPLPCQNIFEATWQMMSHRNFQKVSANDPAQELPTDPMQTDQNGMFDQDLLDEATKIVSAIDERFEENLKNLDQVEDMDNVDLYTAEAPSGPQDQNSNVIALNASQSLAGGNSVSELASYDRNLKEEAQLSLAIQYSMESSQQSMEDEENQLQKALELSRTMTNHEAPDKSPQSRVQQQKKDISASLQETIRAANSIQLTVFAGYLADLSRVEIAFGKRVSHKQVEEKLEHRSVKKMSEYHVKCLEMIQRKHAVDIHVQGTIITVSGFEHFQPAAMREVKLLLEKVKNCLSWHEVLRTVQWVVHDPASSNTTPYSPDATEFIEIAWRSKRKKLDILLDNQPHVIDFEKMLECNVASQKTVKISRIISDLEFDEIPEEEYSLMSNMPEITNVSDDSDEFQNVVKHFYDTIKGYHSKIRIVQVQKLMNRLLYNQFKLKKASIMKRATHPEVERTLYHGTNEKSMIEICLHGFNRSFCGKNATVYGQGVYFAVNSALSVQDQYSPPNADGHKFVLVSKVLTGDFTKGCPTMKTTPLKEQHSIPLRYDSVTDNITNPSMFVIFNDTQAFPEYLITCQRISH